ncbi:hypothetical protein RF11_13296 [Thelohanellus kitauei]|uniref:Uncharacterized protein n=1 Tax=Thelohanellus kitauei TaxID=669202 RepID=A0A0C2N9X2_THEKT|nr:hypothetical protein RF11_13296 [Thelohanellus kitauei]
MAQDEELIELFDFLEADERLSTSGSYTLKEISEEILCSGEAVESEDDDFTVKEEAVSFDGAQRTWSTARKFTCDASVRSARQRDARDPPKEDAPADYSSEFWTDK